MKNINSNSDENQNDVLNPSKMSDLGYLIAIIDIFPLIALSIGTVYIFVDPIIGIFVLLVDISFIYLIIQVGNGSKSALLINFIFLILILAWLSTLNWGFPIITS